MIWIFLAKIQKNLNTYYFITKKKREKFYIAKLLTKKNMEPKFEEAL
jgi:hypothetical protein